MDPGGLGSEIELLPNAEKADLTRPQLSPGGAASVATDGDDVVLEPPKAADSPACWNVR